MLYYKITKDLILAFLGNNNFKTGENLMIPLVVFKKILLLR